ncbi:MAG: hypothetical protein Q8909_02315 [Bacteroidota bacterium]|nr:hypothetical protein [Bacteroidota bacterium]
MKKLYFNLVLFILIPFLGAHAQSKNLSFFGSYNKGYGNITSKVSSDLYYPAKDEVEKLRNGKTNQFEVGAFYKHVGLGFIHNGYSKNASTDFINTDFNGDGITDAGELSDNLKLNYNGVELLYKFNVFNNKVDVIWKYAIGGQNYSLDKKIQLIQNSNLSISEFTFDKTIFTSLVGAEINYHIFKMLSIGAEVSLLPGNYKDLKSGNSYYTAKDNVSRINTGLKATVTL